MKEKTVKVYVRIRPFVEIESNSQPFIEIGDDNNVIFKFRLL